MALDAQAEGVCISAVGDVVQTRIRNFKHAKSLFELGRWRAEEKTKLDGAGGINDKLARTLTVYRGGGREGHRHWPSKSEAEPLHCLLNVLYIEYGTMHILEGEQVREMLCMIMLIIFDNILLSIHCTRLHGFAAASRLHGFTAPCTGLWLRGFAIQ